jgi:hypothetical protein
MGSNARNWRALITVLLIPLLVLPLQAQLLASAPAQHADSPIHDLALGADGTLEGWVVDSSGQPLPKQIVRLRSSGGRAAETSTDAAGRFAFRPRGGGVYGIETQGSVHFCRVWTAQAAPPAAHRGPLLLAAASAESVVRGQTPSSHVPPAAHHSWLTPYTASLILAGVVVGGVVLIAIDDDDDAS